MIRASEVEVTTVTPDQIGRCYKVFGSDGKAFYKVESEGDNLVEYTVKWTREQGFTCTCKAGQNAFSNCSAGICKHVRWSLAAAREEKEALAALEAKRLEAVAKRKEAQARVSTIERNAPAWMMQGPVAHHMRYAPRELD